MTLSRVTTISLSIGKEKLLLSLTFYYHFLIFKASRVTMEEWNQLLFTIPSHKNAVCFLVQLTAFRIFSRLWLSQFRLVRAHVGTEFSSIFLIVVLEPWHVMRDDLKKKRRQTITHTPCNGIDCQIAIAVPSFYFFPEMR